MASENFTLDTTFIFKNFIENNLNNISLPYTILRFSTLMLYYVIILALYEKIYI